MAFDMYIGKVRAYINHHEEEFLEIINQDEAYPKLNWLWENFYNGPHIYPDVANEIVHELINLKALISLLNNGKHLVHAIDRITPFFNKSYKSGEIIRCVSD